jgi:hypothetical protein
MRSLNSRSVLILNKNWIPINTTTPKHSFALLYNDNAKSLNFKKDGDMELISWDEWINLDVDNDLFVNTIRGGIKIPKIIVLTYFDKIPKQAIKFTQKNIWERDNYTCQYTGKKINKFNGNIDHVVPRSKGGKTSWENCVLAHKDINAKKANNSPEEVGLKLLKKPNEPKIMPVSFYIRNEYEIKEWDMFLNKT